MKTFAAWRRWRAIGSLVFWSLIGVWLFLRPQYRDWRHQFAIVVLVYVLIDSILELKWSASPDANRRYGAKLKNEW